jgi:hypothetical protein
LEVSVSALSTKDGSNEAPPFFVDFARPRFNSVHDGAAVGSIA